MTSKIIRPASVVKQGQLTLYCVSLKVSHLLVKNFYSVEKLDPEDKTDSGFQRLLNRGRAKRLSEYILGGIDSKDAFLPTSIFMATDKHIPFNDADNTIEIDTLQIGPLSVVDGQHRVEGLKLAAEKDSRVLDFEIPVNIAIDLPVIAQMCHFLIVNTTQKSVDKGVEQRIYQRLTHAVGVADGLPKLPKWIAKTVEKGEDDSALKYIDYLNNAANSPWKGRIRIANKEDNEGVINQQSFVKAVKKYILVASNPLIYQSEDKQLGIFLNYWISIVNVIDPDENAVLFKYNGVEVFCRFFVSFVAVLNNSTNFTVAAMKELLEKTFEDVEGDYAGVGHSEFWKKGGTASFLNLGAMNLVNAALVRALHQSGAQKNIQL